MEKSLESLQRCEVEILNEFVRICKKFSLNYFVVGGTLLGAIRHQGFIPWDDDIDVAMLREDYEYFAKFCSKELDEQYFYQCAETDPNYFLSYAKIRKKNTCAFENRFRNSKFQNGVFIDIIPLDFCPRPGIICHFLFNVLAVMNYRGQVDSGEEYRPYREFSGKMGYCFLRFFGKRQLWRLRKRVLNMSAKLSKKNYLASYSGAYGYYREVFPISWFGKGSTVWFWGGQYAGPSEPDKILSQIYGKEYMRFPPVEDRLGHIDLEKSVF